MAQLGARFHGMEEVIGSIPIRSTNKPFNLLPPSLTATYRKFATAQPFKRRIVPVSDVPAATVFETVPNLRMFSWSKFSR